MSKKRLIVKHITDHDTDMTEFMYTEGVHYVDEFSITDDRENEEVIIQVDGGSDNSGTIVMNRKWFKEFVALLKYHFIEDLEVTQEDADYATRILS